MGGRIFPVQALVNQGARPASSKSIIPCQEREPNPSALQEGCGREVPVESA